MFFGICTVALGIKLFDRKPGFIINDDGITDNSSGAFINGFIPWSDVTGVRKTAIEIRYSRQNFVLIYVRNPQEYINRNKFFLAKKTKAWSYKYFGTPIVISANGLKIKFETLRAIITAEYAIFLDKKSKQD